ncbi:MAG: hypothetical protein Q8J97_10240, partial [Flavobacteriaceae bacterium]|nr:hypothetical protein [Flavobacteriaceae bacterium]
MQSNVQSRMREFIVGDAKDDSAVKQPPAVPLTLPVPTREDVTTDDQPLTDDGRQALPARVTMSNVVWAEKTSEPQAV